jgi:hypothetical protein
VCEGIAKRDGELRHLASVASRARRVKVGRRAWMKAPVAC